MIKLYFIRFNTFCTLFHFENSPAFAIVYLYLQQQHPQQKRHSRHEHAIPRQYSMQLIMHIKITNNITPPTTSPLEISKIKVFSLWHFFYSAS
jgi:hypothetical protein